MEMSGMKIWFRRAVFLVLPALALSALFGCARKNEAPDIVIAKDASWYERAAATEIRRYFYLTTGELPVIREAESLSRVPAGSVAVLEKGGTLARGLDEAGADSKIAALGLEDYWLKTVSRGSPKTVLVAGGSGPAVLYGAYQLAEKLGVRFFLEGDVVPDGTVENLSLDLDETGHPLFAVRGIQPFHDFPEGPDWWTLENYKAILGQLPKLRMNFFGLHTYPENPSKEKGATPNAEPTVWIGREGDFGLEGKVAASYPASYQNTARGNWGYEAKKTGDFHFGAGLLFERDDFGNDVMSGFSPDPATPEASNEVFNRAAAVFRNAFSLARRLGVKTCVGTETALTVPDLVKKRLADSGRKPEDPAVVKDLYKAMFKRIAAAYPVDYYWFWTNEGWTSDDASPEAINAVTTDLAMGVEAWREAAPPFSLATCGWVLGPPSNRTLFDQVLPKDVAMSCINREVGKAPVDPSFSRISGRSLWAIPWMEDDPGLTSPQLWAGRMRRDAADALRYGCDGLVGIHWRTRILSGNVLALARAAWDQSWNTLPKTERHLPALDFYEDWCRAQFGAGAAAEIAAVFARLDGRHPVPVTWIGGPGNIRPDPRPWDEVKAAYGFVDELAALGPRIAGRGNTERYDYWLRNFQYMREVARFNCLWAVYNKALEKAKSAKDDERAMKTIVRAEALPVRAEMAAALREIYTALLATVSNTGELGTIANWEQHLLPGAWERPEGDLASMLGEELPPEVLLSRAYDGPPRVIVPAVRTSLEAGEALSLKVLVLAKGRPVSVGLRWREMGKGSFRSVPLENIARAVYSVTVPAPARDIEYYVEVKADARTVVYPATAPERNQTVVILPEVR
jgi:hypothetical protein